MYYKNFEFKCPFCGGNDFYFEGTFTTEAVFDEGLYEFVYGKLYPGDFSEMFCSCCGKSINEEELLNQGYTTELIEDDYIIENREFQVVYDLHDLEKCSRTFEQAKDFFERVLDYEGDYRALRCTIDGRIISIHVNEI
jgi:hypothetical protein